jgi:hypothetical protein
LLRTRCHCQQRGCVAQPGGQIAFDLMQRGSQLEGSIELKSGVVRNVRLTRH